MTSNNKTHPKRLHSNRVGLNPSEEGVIQVSHDTTWDEKVKRGRALVTEINDRKWELGDLANEVAPATPPGAHNATLWQFASEIGVKPSTLNEYRLISKAWAPSTRVLGQTWQTHRMLAAHADRHEIIAEQVWTYNSLSERLGRQPNPTRNITVDRDTGEIITGKPTVEQVREAIKADPTIERAARKALDEKYEAAPKPIVKADPSVQDDAVDLVNEFRRLHIGVDRIVQLVNEGKTVSSEAAREAILREIGWLRTALGYIENGVESDSLADEVAAFLQEVS